MLNKGPIIIVDDDIEDQELLMLCLELLETDVCAKFFNSAEAALNYLHETSEQPFVIVSDVNMPLMDGITFKKTIEASEILKSKCIPFVFLSTSTKSVKEICDLNIQGYFEKGNSLEQLSETMNIILKYWDRTRHLN